MAIGAVWKQPEPLEATIRGRDLVTGLPKEVIITDSDIQEAIAVSVSNLVESIKEVLETTPPEVISDIIHKGLTLVGGGALLNGLDQLLLYELKIPITIAADPLTAVVRGAGIILERLEEHRDILVADDDRLPPS